MTLKLFNSIRLDIGREGIPNIVAVCMLLVCTWYLVGEEVYRFYCLVTYRGQLAAETRELARHILDVRRHDIRQQLDVVGGRGLVIAEAWLGLEVNAALEVNEKGDNGRSDSEIAIPASATRHRKQRCRSTVRISLVCVGVCVCVCVWVCVGVCMHV